MQVGGEEAYECRVRWTELRAWARAVTDILEWVTSPLRLLWPVAASIGLKILGRGDFPSVSSNKRRKLPSTQSSPPTSSHTARIYRQFAWAQCRCSLQSPCRLRGYDHLAASQLLFYMPSTMHSVSNDQARNDATSWQCLFDLLVDAAGKVTDSWFDTA
jgi:hypothetical protein